MMSSVEEKAIIDSVMKWDLIAQGIGVDAGGRNCPLCILYGKCDLCSVTRRGPSDGWNCNNTPYHSIALTSGIILPTWISLMKGGSLHCFSEIIEGTLNEIEKEIEFLISLLPEEHELRKL